MSRRLTMWAALAAIAAQPLNAQPHGAQPDESACGYARCALSIAPRWNGLAVVRGHDEERIANLHFFWPRDIVAVFARTETSRSDSAAVQARRAVRVRRVAATLSNAGAVVSTVVAWRAIAASGLRSGDGAVLAGAAAALAVSVPLHFSADGALSRAIWWYNRRFASSP